MLRGGCPLEGFGWAGLAGLGWLGGWLGGWLLAWMWAMGWPVTILLSGNYPGTIRDLGWPNWLGSVWLDWLHGLAWTPPLPLTPFP